MRQGTTHSANVSGLADAVPVWDGTQRSSRPAHHQEDSVVTDGHNPLWSDEPTGRDLLSFVAVAETVADAVLDDKLDPIALGLSGSWGAARPASWSWSSRWCRRARRRRPRSWSSRLSRG